MLLTFMFSTQIENILKVWPVLYFFTSRKLNKGDTKIKLIDEYIFF